MTIRIFDRAFDLLMQNEGGYVNDPNDSGGETKYGISKKAYPSVDIPSLTVEQAKAIYRRDYWDRCKLDYFPDALSVAVFDFAVNSGCVKAVKVLQEVMNMTVDGVVGNQTIGAANRLPVRPVLEDYCKKRLAYLLTLKGWRRYGAGWGVRVKRVQAFCEDLI